MPAGKMRGGGEEREEAAVGAGAGAPGAVLGGRVLRVVGGEVEAVVAVVVREAEDGRVGSGLAGGMGPDIFWGLWPLVGCGER